MAKDNLEAKELLAMGIKDFDFKHCPYCGCEFDTHKDFYWDHDLKYRHAVYLFKCHECHTLYEVQPVVTSYRARRLDEQFQCFSF